MTIRTALQHGIELFERDGISAPRLTAEVLLAQVLGRERSYLYGHSDEPLPAPAQAAYASAIERRLAGTPTQYITGHQEFYGREFLVTPDVLIPRPETEHVVETALRLAPHDARILDAGCGSGVIAVSLSLEMPGAPLAVLATDISSAALTVAARNASTLGARVHFAACDFASAVVAHSVDLLVSNPPYIPIEEESGLPREVREHEPRQALFAGLGGLDAYRALIADAPRVLRVGGWLVLELGYRQADAVTRMLDGRWSGIEIVNDLAGLPRVLAAQIEA
ncbi:MAG: peptide chain release factor N(5)-glutamine methyltransferase [Bryobacteraceae bacterium]